MLCDDLISEPARVRCEIVEAIVPPKSTVKSSRVLV